MIIQSCLRKETASSRLEAIKLSGQLPSCSSPGSLKVQGNPFARGKQRNKKKHNMQQTQHHHPTTYIASTANKSNFYLGVIVFLTLAWLVTMVVCYLTHKPCTCRGVVIEHPQPTHVAHRVPFVGTFHLPVVNSPDATSSLETILDFLRKKGTSISGQPFNSEIHKALNLAYLWQWNTNSNPPVGVLNAPGVTSVPYYLVYDATQRQWTITTVAP